MPSGAVAAGFGTGAVARGFGAGAVLAVLSLLTEHSLFAAGDHAPSGTGAIIVPAILAPWAVYWGWTGILARGGRALEMALFVAGLHFGVGLWILLDALVFPREAGLALADALSGFVLSGSILVLPAALLAGLAYRLFAVRLPLNSWTLFAAAFAAALLVVALWAGLGILAGTCVAAAAREPSRRVRIGAALLVLLIVIGALPFFPGLAGS